MAKILSMKRRKRDTLIRKFTDISASIWDAAFMKDFMWAKIPTSPT